MLSDSSETSDKDFNFSPQLTHSRPKKRVKRSGGRSSHIDSSIPSFSLDPLLSYAAAHTSESFDDIIESLLPEHLQARRNLQDTNIEVDEKGSRLRPLTRLEVSSAIKNLTNSTESLSLSENIVLRKLKIHQQKSRAGLRKRSISAPHLPLTPLLPRPSLPVYPQVIDALYGIQTTPFHQSILWRLRGTRANQDAGLIAVDWETVTPWMSLMGDVRDHYLLAHPEREQPIETIAPIIYMPLSSWQLPQIHDLLERAFWTGIDVNDSLEYWPEKCTIVATYKKLVVGVAIMSSPQETYITYLAVRAGWDKAQIARTMLYHLITLNPNRDITLHVSVNNSAMLLYNQFGFKAEEFVAGFYEDYLNPVSRASKNAFKLRLRRQ